jgi:hypothetical protein
MFGRMRLYTVHVRTDEPQLQRKPLFIKEGFNFAAFFLTGFWALYHRLWWQAAVMFAFNIVLPTVVGHHFISHFGMVILQMGFNILVGFQANDWRREGLQKRGYIFADITAADSLLRAQQRYFERSLATV